MRAGNKETLMALVKEGKEERNQSESEGLRTVRIWCRAGLAHENQAKTADQRVRDGKPTME